ncbi:MAG TPA: helix-turn-helix transcriptional regulator [Candidatus Saccharimonadales bacterium]|nr:helix-turn-helix transcriptional regulator [Candidatus Saccharimonadales bacterium]
MSKEANAPYKTLGSHLKYVREQSRQTLMEVSGAVEIEEERLKRIEAGEERPAEDILLLLISHFGVADREAVQLWELADYDSDMPGHLKSEPAEQHLSKNNVVMLVGFDTRTIYSDGLDALWNDAGLTLNFTQATGPSQRMSVAKVGMSYEQAEKVMRTLQKALLHARYVGDTKLLPPPKRKL